MRIPQVEAPPLEGLAVEVLSPPPPSGEDLILRLNERLRAGAPRRRRDVGEAVQAGDELECDLVTLIDGLVLPGSVHRWPNLELRAFQHVPGLAEAIEGTRCGARRLIELELPQDYPVEDAAGRQAQFHLFIRGAVEVTAPDLDDLEAIEAAGLGNSLEEAMDRLAVEADEDLGQRLLVEATQAVLKALSSRVEVEISDELIDEELLLIWEGSDGRVLEDAGFEEEVLDQAFEDFLQDPDLRGQAQSRLKTSLALAALVREEQLAPSGEMVQELVEMTADQVGVNWIQAREALSAEPGAAHRFLDAALHLTAVEFVMERAQVTVID